MNMPSNPPPLEKVNQSFGGVGALEYDAVGKRDQMNKQAELYEALKVQMEE